MTMLEEFIGRARSLQQELDYMGVGRPDKAPAKTKRGTSNGNSAGSAEDRRRRRAWLVETYRADVDADIHLRSTDGKLWEVPLGEGRPACRCYRCGILMAEGFRGLLTVDRIVPGREGGTYRRTNIRPACGDCNSETGGRLGGLARLSTKHRCVDCRKEDPNDTRRPRPIVAWSGAERCATHLRKRAGRAKSTKSR